MERNIDTVIIGGGLSGLTIALGLKKAGKSFVVLESEAKVGGVIQTYAKNNFVYESGPNTGVYSTPELVQLFDDLKGRCQLEMADESSKKRLIWKGKKWRAMPSGLLGGIATPLFTLYDKFRILGEPFRKPGNDPYESVAGLVKRRMGNSFLNYAVDPFISGVYAGDPEKLITKFALPKLYNLEQNYGSFIGGAIKKAKEPKTDLELRATREVFSVKGGLGKLIEALCEALDEENIITASDISVVEKDGDNGYIVRLKNGLKFRSKSVVTTFGGDSLGRLLPFADSSQIDTIGELNYARVVQVALGYNKWTGIKLDAFGGLVPSREERNVLGILFPSAIFKERAPHGGALLSVFLGGFRNADIIYLDDDKIREIVLNEVKLMMKTEHVEPDMFEIFRYFRAIPQYELSSERRFKAIEAIQDANKGLYIAGNIRNGIGIADRVAQGASISNEIINYLQ